MARRRRTALVTLFLAVLIAALLGLLAVLAVPLCTGVPSSAWSFQTQTAETAAEEAAGPLTATFIDVGQGDSCFLELPDGRAVLVDGGDYRCGDTLLNTLHESGHDHIDIMLATHPHADHIGGLIDVLAAVDVSELWMPRYEVGTATESEFLDAVAAEQCEVVYAKEGMTLFSGAGAEARVLWPPTSADFEDPNDWSAIVYVTCNGRSLLLTGDAHADLIEEACLQAGVGPVDILKVSHHGSETGTTAELAHVLRPSVAVLSYGADNPYGHPDASVVDALESVGCEVHATAEEGTISLSL